MQTHRFSQKHPATKSRSTQRAPPTSRRGAATVELALCLPLLGALTLGLCELGQAVLSSAARLSCATGSLPGCSNTDVINDAKRVLTASKIPTGAVTITIKVNDQTGDVLNAAANDKISVTVSIPISQVNWTNTRRYFGANSELSQTVVMARQG
jgi:hypothetical protein